MIKPIKELDILAIDKKGKLVVIELKRDVAEAFVDLQAIHYAAYCSTFTLDQIVEIRSEYNNESKDKNLEEIINFIKEENFLDFDNQPRIILVANNFQEETLAAVLWLRDSGIDITCVKLGAYELDEQIVITPDIIVPLPEAKQFMVYREQKTKTALKNNNIHLDEESFFKELEQRGEEEVQIVNKIREWAKENLPRFTFSKNLSYAVFWPCLDYNTVSYWPIDIRTDGKITILFQYLKDKKPFDDEKLRLKLLDNLNKIEGVDISIDRIGGRPTFPLIILKDEKSMEIFICTLNWVVNKIKEVNN